MEHRLLHHRPPARLAKVRRLPDRAPARTEESKRNSVYTLGDDAILALGRRPEVIKVFPFLRVHKPQIKSNCKCNKSAEERKYYKKVVDGLKHALLSMDTTKKITLKRLLNVGSILIYLNGPRGVEKHTI